MQQLKLGLIGDNISASKAPLLHQLAGRLNGIEVSYERLVPHDLGMSFEQIFAHCRESGFHGINVTYPYKEDVLRYIEVPNDTIRALGAVNTVVFQATTALGYNTDFSGFVSSYFEKFGLSPPARVCLIGAGGVARAIAFGLAQIGAKALVVTDIDAVRAAALSAAVRSHFASLDVSVAPDALSAAKGAQAVINCTPVGMHGHPGSPIDSAAMTGARWVFDAVYTPTNTLFLQHARAAGLTTLSGFELFFHQGLKAFEVFSGLQLDASALRGELENELSKDA